MWVYNLNTVTDKKMPLQCHFKYAVEICEGYYEWLAHMYNLFVSDII